MDGKAKTEKLLAKWDAAEEKVIKIRKEHSKWLTQMCKKYYKDTKKTRMYFISSIPFEFAPLMQDYCEGIEFDKKGENILFITRINHLNVKLHDEVLNQIIKEVTKIVFK